MALKLIKTLLEKKIGLSEKAIASDLVEKAFQNRMSVVNITEIAEYAQYIGSNQDELNELIEMLVVPETWFFRNEASFDFLKNHIKYQPVNSYNEKKIRILCIPCSTGEEPYSIVMTLLNAGINESDFHVDALDISERVLRLAGTGIYHQGAFRGKMIEYHKHFFKKTNDYYKILTSVKSNVRFIKGNLLDNQLLKNSSPYDIIFCRNLLIYFSDSAKNLAVNNIDRLLSPDGLLFLGHAEYEPLRNFGFEWIFPPRAFVCRRKKVSKILPEINIDKKLNSKDTGLSDLNQNGFIKNDHLQQSEIINKKIISQADSTLINNRINNRKKLEDGLSKPLKTMPAEEKRKNLLETAQLLADRGALDEAFKKCSEYINKHPAHVHAHFLMGMFYQSVENYKEAEQYMNKTIYLDPYHCDAMEQLALIAEYRQDFTKSKQLRQRIQRILERKKTL